VKNLENLEKCLKLFLKHTYIADLELKGLEFESRIRRWVLYMDLDVNKGPGPDKIPPLILKKCATSFSLPLFLIYNRSLVTCVFPEKWKLSFVTPIYKNGKRNDVANYCGIAILSAVAKLFELLICRTIYTVKNFIYFIVKIHSKVV
jgi:hypothetical protein